MRTIILSGEIGGVAMVDDDDYLAIAKHIWWADVKSHTTYAYTQTLVDGARRTIRMHQMILGVADADHKDGNGLNNQRANLRSAIRRQQAWNTVGRGPFRKGVTKLKRLQERPWQARIKFNGVQYHLGYFATEEEAASAYDKAATKNYGEFAKLNGVAVELSDNKRRRVISSETFIADKNGRNGKRAGHVTQLLECGHLVQSPLAHLSKLGEFTHCQIC